MSIRTNFLADKALWVVEILDELSRAGDKSLLTELTHVLANIGAEGGESVQLWVHNVDDESDGVALSLGAVAYRDLWQLRCQLPAATSPLTTRAFTPGDAEALVAVNNRAFSWHPEQSGMTVESLAATMAEPWFNADGFRLFEIHDELKGFCWTKVHHEMDPIHGEIYVIAVDPSVHGQGLGTPMTLAGLDWIAAQGIEHALLYVESDNDPANATYNRIGFEHHQTNRAYNLIVGST